MEALFPAKQSGLAQEKDNQNENPMLYSCGLCAKGYRSSKAYSQHLKSRTHIIRASQGTNHPEEMKAIIKPLPRHAINKPPKPRGRNDKESEDEWVEVDPEEHLVGQAANSFNVNEQASGDEMDTDEEEEEELDPCCCFTCDLDLDTIESCMVHMHEFHGFFIPDVEYLKEPEGLLTYLGPKPKGHCKVHYGDGDEDGEAELEEFYDYGSRYRSMGLATVQSREQIVRMKVTKAMA
ncbi:hypothetical protein CRYUN_Cryun26dG0001400 [Craigia yunnanensis]